MKMMLLIMSLMVFLYSANPTYGKGPDNTVMLRAAGGASGNAGKGKKDFSNSSAMQQDTYEVIRYEAVNKKVGLICYFYSCLEQ